MSSLEDIFSTNQCPTAVFTSQGTDVTPNGDRGVCKVILSLVTLYHSCKFTISVFFSCSCEWYIGSKSSPILYSFLIEYKLLFKKRKITFYIISLTEKNSQCLWNVPKNIVSLKKGTVDYHCNLSLLKLYYFHINFRRFHT